MSDYSALTLTVYDCPPEQRETVLETMRTYGIGDDEGNGDGLRFGVDYHDFEARLDAYAEVAGVLMTEAPGASFRIWNDPKYEWLGGLMLYTPDLGAWGHNCDADGQPVFSVDEVLKIAEMQPDERRRALGLEWSDALASKASGQ